MNYEDFDLNLIKVFVSVYESGGIVSASKKLYVSQPAVTMSIKKLENIVGSKLFIRLQKGIKPTPEGENFYNYCKSSLKQLNIGLNEFEKYNMLNSGTLTIGASHDIINYLLMPKMQKFLQIYPNISINFVEAISKRLPIYMLRGDIDVAFLEDKHIDGDYECEIFESLENVFFKPKNLKLQNDNSFFDNNFAVYKKDSGNNLSFKNFCSENNLNLNVKFTVSNYLTMEKICTISQCLGFAPKKYVDLNKFDIIKSDCKIDDTKINLCFSKNQNLSSSCIKFIEFIKK